MIKYSLICPKSHEFEGWFPSSKGFDAQAKKKLVTCPVCGSTEVEKALMAPRVQTSRQKTEARVKRQQEITAAQAFAKAAEAAVSEPSGPASRPVQLAFSPEQREMLRELKKMRDKVLAQSDYVGPRFAEEARRIHQENEATKQTASTKKGRRRKSTDAPQRGPALRGIHGEASPQEVKALLEDGIEVYPIPVLPDDKN